MGAAPCMHADVTRRKQQARYRLERQYNACANRKKQCRPNETNPYSNATHPRERQMILQIVVCCVCCMVHMCGDMFDSALTWLCVGLLPLIWRFILVMFGLVSLAPYCFLQMSFVSTVCGIARCVGSWVVLALFCLLRVIHRCA